MAITFRADEHKYSSVDPEDKTEWLSVTSVLSNFKEPFDAMAISEKVSKSRKSKWFGIPPQEIRAIWEGEGKRATDLGTYYHNQREAELTSHEFLQRNGVDLPIIAPLMQNDLKVAPIQRLVDGIYPEHFMYLKSAGICGQSDRVEIMNGFVDIFDYKTNKEIVREGFKDFSTGKNKRLLHCLKHLDDCNFNHYALQLSVYMYMIIKHNPLLKPRNMFIHHIKFEEEGTDKYGYPITKRTPEGDPIVKEVVEIPVPYMKAEAIAIINWIHENRKFVKKKS